MSAISRLPAIAVASLVSVLAFGGGLAATASYHHWVIAPTDAPPVAVHLRAMDVPRADVPEGDIDALFQALEVARRDLPATALMDVRPRRAEGGVVFLEGHVDSRRTLAIAVEMAGRVPDVRAVDPRGVTLVVRRHTVQAGESPSRIARNYYGRGSAWWRLAEANPSLQAGHLRVGQELLIPPADL
jgi:nucleoid-associated protein YgaU